ncbi:hypothetical protein KCP71_15505 [Salmonella enterica subsp. enterica]|nr:hypothetical protein KCP71_15505 [Salmonella enterica subsp. enterica]
MSCGTTIYRRLMRLPGKSIPIRILPWKPESRQMLRIHRFKGMNTAAEKLRSD